MKARIVLQSPAVAPQVFTRPSGRRVLLLSSLLRHVSYMDCIRIQCSASLQPIRSGASASAAETPALPFSTRDNATRLTRSRSVWKGPIPALFSFPI